MTNFRGITSVDELFCKLMEEFESSLGKLDEPFDIDVKIGTDSIYVRQKSTDEVLSKIPYKKEDLINFFNEFTDRIK